MGLAFASPFLGWVSTAIQSRKWPLAFSALVGGVSFALVLFVPMNAWVLGLLLFFAGAACSGQALSFTVVKENNSDKTVATAIAFNNMAVVISGALFQPLIGWVISIGQGAAGDYTWGLSLILGAYIIAFAIAAMLLIDPLAKMRKTKLSSSMQAGMQTS